MEFVEQPNNHWQVHQKHYPVASKEQEDAQQGVGSELGYHPEVQSPAALLGIQVVALQIRQRQDLQKSTVKMVFFYKKCKLT